MTGYPDPSKTVTAVVVNYNSGDDCARLLRQLDSQTGLDQLKIIVIDSSSRDNSLARAVQAATSMSTEVTFLEPGRNVGYTGNNLGMEGAEGSVFLVNPDVELESPRILFDLRQLLQGDPGLAAVAPMICNDGVVEYADSVADFGSTRIEHTLTHRVDWPHRDRIVNLPWVNGAAWLLDAEAIREVGPLDERYFLFFEETDWCLRAAKHGWRVALTADVQVAHRRSSSFGTSTKGAYYYWRNLFLLCREHGGTGWKWAYLRRVVRFVGSRTAWRSHQSWRAVQGLLHATTGRFGPGPEDRR